MSEIVYAFIMVVVLLGGAFVLGYYQMVIPFVALVALVAVLIAVGSA